jgi:hypothetical protein
MILGMSTQTFILLHVVISLIGIFSGFIAIIGMLDSRRPGGWAALFLITTILTSITGFPIPPFGFDPPRAVGVISLIAITAVHLTLKAKVPGADQATFEKLSGMAKAGCPVSKLLNAEITLDAELIGSEHVF